MPSRDFRDILTGAVICGIGSFVAWYAYSTLELGTTQNMGPGMFPIGLGVLLAVLGLAILVPACFRAGSLPGMEPRAALTIIAAIAAFALLLDYLGTIAAVFGMTFIAATASPKFRPRVALILGAALLGIVLLIFRVGLGMPLPLFTWGF